MQDKVKIHLYLIIQYAGLLVFSPPLLNPKISPQFKVCPPPGPIVSHFTLTVFPSLRHEGLIYYFFEIAGIISEPGLISGTTIGMGLIFL